MFDKSKTNIVERAVKVTQLVFGNTDLAARLEDIKEETDELINYTSAENLKEETSDLLCSLLCLIHEQGYDLEQLITEYNNKLISRFNSGHYLKTGEQTKDEKVV